VQAVRELESGAQCASAVKAVYFMERSCPTSSGLLRVPLDQCTHLEDVFPADLPPPIPELNSIIDQQYAPDFFGT
jgi:hypothetical protein